MKLYSDHLDTRIGTVNDCRHERVTQLQAEGYTATYRPKQHAVAPSSDGEVAYRIGIVKTLPEPMSDETDVVEDTIEVAVCACDDFWFRQSAEDGEMLPPNEWGECKHIQSVYREKRAENDEHQQEL